MADNKETSNEFLLSDFLPYNTCREILAYRNEMYQARERILATYPTLMQDCEGKRAYSKYSVNGDDNLGGFSPSAIRYLVDNRPKAKVTDTVPILNERIDHYIECVYDANGNPLIFKGHTCGFNDDYVSSTLYAVDFEGYKYIINMPSPANCLSEFEDTAVMRIKYQDDKILSYECCHKGYLILESCYAEKYFNYDGVDYCITEALCYEFSRYGESLEEVRHYFETEYAEKYLNIADSMTLQMNLKKREETLKSCQEFFDNLDVPVTEKLSPVCRVCLYQLSFNSRKKLQQLEELNLRNGEYRIVYPKKPKTPSPSGLPKTKESAKVLRQRLKDNGYSAKKGIAFKTFWAIFKEFVFNDKFDCAEESLLWEPIQYSNRKALSITRQFCHNNADGAYDFMEQFSVEFDIQFTQMTENPFEKSFASEGDFVKFFEKVEQCNEFKSSDPDTVIKLSMYFGEV